MVCGLGKMLRKCGVDTVVLDSEDSHDVCVRIANQQNRMIITRGHVYNLVRDNSIKIVGFVSDDAGGEVMVCRVELCCNRMTLCANAVTLFTQT